MSIFNAVSLSDRAPWAWILIGFAPLVWLGGAALSAHGHMNATGLTDLVVGTMVLLGAGILCLSMRSHDLSRRRVNSLALVQSVLIDSAIYRDALAGVRQVLDHESASSTTEARQLQYLLELFQTIAIGIRERAIDERVVRPALERDLRVVFAAGRSCTDHADAVEAVGWLADRWGVHSVR